MPKTAKRNDLVAMPAERKNIAPHINTMMNKFKSARNAVELVCDAVTVATSGFGFAGAPEEIFAALGRRFRETGHPSGLTLVFSSAQGDSVNRGLDHLAQKGMLCRVIGGFYGVTPGLSRLVSSNEIEAYNLPQGQITRLYHSIATKQPGLLTRIGLGTFVDPRLEGGKLNGATSKDLIEVMTIAGQEYLFYHSFPIHVALIRGTTADERGNISMEREAVRIETLPLACAARASGGMVIVQVERIVARHTIPPRQVELPGYLVDVIVVSEKPDENHRQSIKRAYSPVHCGELRAPTSDLAHFPRGERRLIALRAACEIREGAVVNLGTGIPEGVGIVLAEKGLSDSVYLTIESGVNGGVPETQPDFGISANPEAIIRHDDQFCFYNAGGIDIAFLAFAQVDADGNVNVSRFSGRMVGCGGFVDIAQNAKEMVFCGTFTSGGLHTKMSAAGVTIEREGRFQKFVKHVEQITFSGKYAQSIGQKVLFVTERCVLELTINGLMVTEIAAGVDLQKDIIGQMGFSPLISPSLRTMSRECFD